MLSEKTADQVRRWVGLPLGSTVLDVTRSATSRGYHVAYRPTVGCTLQVLFCEDEVRSDVWELLACAARECLGVEHPTRTARTRSRTSTAGRYTWTRTPDTIPIALVRDHSMRWSDGTAVTVHKGAYYPRDVWRPVPELAAASNVMACVADALMAQRTLRYEGRDEPRQPEPWQPPQPPDHVTAATLNSLFGEMHAVMMQAALADGTAAVTSLFKGFTLKPKHDSADWSAKVREGVKQSELKRKEQEARAVGWDPEPE